MSISLLPTDFRFTVEDSEYFVRAELDVFAGAPQVICCAQDPSNLLWTYAILIEANQSIVDSHGGVEGFYGYALGRINDMLDVRHPNPEQPIGDDLLTQLQQFLASSVECVDGRLKIK